MLPEEIKAQAKLLRKFAASDIKKSEFSSETVIGLIKFVFYKLQQDRLEAKHVIVAGMILRYIDGHRMRVGTQARDQLYQVLNSPDVTLHDQYHKVSATYRFYTDIPTVIVSNVEHVFTAFTRVSAAKEQLQEKYLREYKQFLQKIATKSQSWDDGSDPVSIAKLLLLTPLVTFSASHVQQHLMHILANLANHHFTRYGNTNLLEQSFKFLGSRRDYLTDKINFLLALNAEFDVETRIKFASLLAARLQDGLILEDALIDKISELNLGTNPRCQTPKIGQNLIAQFDVAAKVKDLTVMVRQIMDSAYYADQALEFNLQTTVCIREGENRGLYRFCNLNCSVLYQGGKYTFVGPSPIIGALEFSYDQARMVAEHILETCQMNLHKMCKTSTITESSMLITLLSFVQYQSMQVARPLILSRPKTPNELRSNTFNDDRPDLGMPRAKSAERLHNQ